MSYYGYPNSGTYGANYPYPYGYEQYQAAFNAAAYQAMQQQQHQQQFGTTPTSTQPPLNQPKTSSSSNGVSISQPAQRYDYSNVNKPSNMQTSANTSSTQHFYSNYSNQTKMYDAATTANAYPPMSVPPAAPTNKPMMSKNMHLQNNKFKSVQKKPNQFKQRRAPTSQQLFYCEICKVSCAGPQTYKEHLDGQKHKKREQTNKLTDAQMMTSNLETPSDINATNVASTTTNIANNGYSATTTNNMKNKNANFKSNVKNESNRNSVLVRCELCDISCTGRDAYAAHIRGIKHQKTLKLHQKLGKPIPPDFLNLPVQSNSNVLSTNFVPASVPYSNIPQPSLIPVASLAPVPPPPPPPSQQQQQLSPSASNVPKPVVFMPMNVSPQQGNTKTVNQEITVEMPVQASEQTQLNTNEEEEECANMQDIDSLGANLEPIGKEYIEARVDGKILSFYCKLCDCSFNDPNAKDMHTKGRRHRLSYKKKVDPSLKVDMKNSSKSKLNQQQQQQQQQIKMSKVKFPQSQINLNNNNNNNTNIKPLMGNTEPLINKPMVSNNSNVNSLMSTQITPTTTTTLQQLMSQPIKFSNTINSNQTRHTESFDDKHIIAKHSSIYPTQEEINAIQEIVNNTEKALRLVSDQISEEDTAKKQNEPNKANETVAVKQEPDSQEAKDATQTSESAQQSFSEPAKEKAKEEISRELKGVMRVGLLAKGLLLRGDTDVKLIVICTNKPTKKLLERVYKALLQKIEVVSPQNKYSVILDKEAETILVVKLNINELQPLITCRILLTSALVREQSDNTIKAENADEELLDKQRCLDSLADLRHAKWFQAKANQVQNCVIIIRVLRDLCQRNSTWTPLSQWALELLVERCLSSATQSLSPGEALRRVFECLSSGLILSYGPGLYDPCEKEPTDVCETLTMQQKEELTASAQMALRLLAFKQIFKVLGMDNLNSNQNKLPQKRHHSSSENDSLSEEKKDKKEAKFDTKQEPSQD